MIKQRFFQQLTINLLFLVLLASCSSIKNKEYFEVKRAIDCYLLNSTKINIFSLNVYTQFDKGKLNMIEIQDYPQEHLYYDINNKRDSLKSVFIGVYKNIPVKLITSESKIFDINNFLKKDSILEMKAIKSMSDLETEEGFFIEEGISEYTPSIITKYYVDKNIKMSELLNGNILTEKWKSCDK